MEVWGFSAFAGVARTGVSCDTDGMVRRASGRENANGEGSVWDRPDGRAGAALYIPNPGGGQRRITTTKKNRREARKWLGQMLADRDGGLVLGTENPSVGEWLKEWLSEVVEPSVAPKTLEKRVYHARVHILPALGHVRLKSLQPRQIHTFYSRMTKRHPPLAPSTRLAIHTTLKMALNQAVKWGLLTLSPVDSVEPPRPTAEEEAEDSEEEVRALSDAQVVRLFGVTEGKRWHNYYIVAIRTGLRPGEMLGLRWGDLVIGTDLDSLRVRRTLAIKEGGGFYTKAPKNKASRRTVTLHWEASDAFTEQRAMLAEEGLPTGGENWVFPSVSGSPMDRGNLLSRNLIPDLEAAKLPRLTLHELRHTFASVMLYEWHVPLEVVAQMMGHKNTRMTQDLYGHLVKSAQADAIRALRKRHKRPETGAS